jgi:hypothetical protein
MSIATDVRYYADTALAQGKAALSNAGTAAVLVNKRVNQRLIADAPKPAYAALGAADLVATAVTRRVEALPTEAVDNVSRVQQNSRTLISRTQNDAIARLQDLRGRLDSSLESVSALPVVARNTTEAYLSTAKDVYGKLTARGEAKAAELRKDPRVSRLLGQASEVAGSVQSTVSPVVKSAFDAVASVNPDTKPARKSTRRPSTRKASTASTTTRKTTTTRTPRKTTTSKTTTTRTPRTSAASTSTASK